MLRDTIEEAVRNAMAQYEKSQEAGADTDEEAQSGASKETEDAGAEEPAAETSKE